MKSKILLNGFLFVIVFYFTCCSQRSQIEKYNEFLQENGNKELFYNDVVLSLGEPEVYKEHKNDITVSWSNNYWGKSIVATDLKGEKLIFTFDKTTKKMLKWEFKKW